MKPLRGTAAAVAGRTVRRPATAIATPDGTSAVPPVERVPAGLRPVARRLAAPRPAARPPVKGAAASRRTAHRWDTAIRWGRPDRRTLRRRRRKSRTALRRLPPRSPLRLVNPESIAFDPIPRPPHLLMWWLFSFPGPSGGRNRPGRCFACFPSGAGLAWPPSCCGPTRGRPQFPALHDVDSPSHGDRSR